MTQHTIEWSYGSKYSKLKKLKKIQLVRIIDICGKVLSEENAYRSVKTRFDADHQNNYLFTNKGHFLSPLLVLIGVIAKFYE